MSVRGRIFGSQRPRTYLACIVHRLTSILPFGGALGDHHATPSIGEPSSIPDPSFLTPAPLSYFHHHLDSRPIERGDGSSFCSCLSCDPGSCTPSIASPSRLLGTRPHLGRPASSSKRTTVPMRLSVSLPRAPMKSLDHHYQPI